jgi:hypothetical protein
VGEQKHKKIVFCSIVGEPLYASCCSMPRAIVSLCSCCFSEGLQSLGWLDEKPARVAEGAPGMAQGAGPFGGLLR